MNKLERDKLLHGTLNDYKFCKNCVSFDEGYCQFHREETSPDSSCDDFSLRMENIAKALQPTYDDLFIMKYHTKHLPYYDTLQKIIGLEGREYTPYLKGVWYSLISAVVSKYFVNPDPNAPLKKCVTVGKNKTDLRISVWFVLPSGQGKKNIKQPFLKILKKLGIECYSPTSFHPEQLIGKVISRKEKPPVVNASGGTKARSIEVYLPNKGYLSKDVLIFDEAFRLLEATNDNLTESRKNLRIAQDPIGENLVEKKSVDNTFEEMLSYYPECVVVLFVQPKVLPSLIAEEGDLRRAIICYKKGISSRDKTQDYKNIILSQNNTLDEENMLLGFMESLKAHIIGRGFVFSHDAKNRLITLHNELVLQGNYHSEKGMQFTAMVDYSLIPTLIKFCCILSVAYGCNECIPSEIVDLAYMDLSEFFDMQLNFVHDKISGSIDYGESWGGAHGKDRYCLEWLFSEGAISYETSKVSIATLKSKICEVHGVKDDMADKHLSRYRKNNWIDAKQEFHDSKVWLGFVPVTPWNHGGNGSNSRNGAEYDIVVNNVDSLLEGLHPLHSLHPSSEERVE